MIRRVLIALLILIVGAVVGWQILRKEQSATIKIGVLHSLTGTMAISEKALVDAIQLAVEEINHRGGISGRRVEMIIADGRSDPAIFAQEAERLIVQERVSTIFGCWTSASRKHVKQVVEKNNHLLIYPLQYEGLEDSQNIIYTGAAPNQQIIPGVKWCLDNIGKRFFLVGSDYIFPRTANAIIRNQITALQGEVVGEEYILLGSKDVHRVVQNIVQARPDVILNTINGDSNVAFFHQLRKAGIHPDKVPTMSFSIAEEELQSMNIDEMAGDYTTWNYFQSIDQTENLEFVKRFKARFGTSRVTDDPIVTAYFSVYLWAQAVEEGQSDSVDSIREGMKDQSLKSPAGIVYIDASTHHTWKPVRVGKILKDGQFEIVWSSEHAVRPIPFPAYRQRASWEAFLTQMYNGWGRKWVNPGNASQRGR